jgi:NADPH:quinone reductase-like Zn-dependent oxidoreductase
MRAVVYDAYGPPERLQLRRMPPPSPGPAQVLVKVHAAGVNPVDWKIRNGSLRLLVPIKFPVIPGFEVSGHLEEIGTEAAKAGWNVGDEIVSYLNDRRGAGGYAEYVAVDASVVARKPSRLSHEEAAGVPLAATTALQSLRDLGQLEAGQEVLVHGASGGVGTFAVQIAKALGGIVTAVCSGANVALVRELGADRVLDYQREDFTAGDSRYHIVFDAVAKSSFFRCRSVLKPRGRYITTLPSPQSVLLQALTKLTRRRCLNILARPSGDDLEIISQMIEAGRVRPILDTVFPLEQAAEAHRRSEEGHVRGKLVLRVVDEHPARRPQSW